MRQKRNIISVFMTGFILCACTVIMQILAPPCAFARTKVQSGVEGPLSQTAHPVTIEAVDRDKSIILFNWRTNQGDNSSNPDVHSWAAKFNSNTQIEFDRLNGGTSNEAYISWHVVESDAFQVEPFQVTFNANQLTTTIDLTNKTPSNADVDFTAGKSFVVRACTNYNTSTANYMNAGYFSAQLSYDTGSGGHDQLILNRYAQETSGTVAASAEVWGYVVKLRDDSTVYQGSSTMGGAFYFITAPILNTLGQSVAVDRSKAALFFNMKNDTTALDMELRGALPSDSTVGFNRRGEGSPYNSDQYWYVLELGTLGRAESGAINVPQNYYSAQYTLTYPANTNLAFTLSTQDSTGTGTALYRVRHTSQFVDNGNKVEFERGEYGQNALCDFFVMQLEPMKLFSPNGGEAWKAGEVKDITWYAPTSIANVELRLSTNGGTSYDTQIVASTSNDGVYEWTIPSISGIIGTNMRVKVRDVNWNELSRTVDIYSMDTSDANFEIICKLAVTYPNGGENISYEAPTDITWNFYGDTSGRTVAVKVSEDNGNNYNTTLVTGLAASVSGSHTVNWTTNPLPLGNLLKIKVEQVTEESRVFDESNSVFAVKGAIDLTTPNGGQTWDIGTSENIVWTAYGGAFMTNGVDIEVSRNAGGSWTTIAAGVAANNSPYPWTVQAPSTSEALIRVRSQDFADAKDQSAAVFTIRARITVDIPSGTGIVWRVGESKNITYTIQGSVPTIDILYDYGSGYTAITPPAGVSTATYPDSYPWTVLDTISDTVKVKIQSHTDTNIY
ncbi:MAG: hypothetical protein ABIA66_01700, partial [Candidatus Omnitrophota bacterium]